MNGIAAADVDAGLGTKPMKAKLAIIYERLVDIPDSATKRATKVALAVLALVLIDLAHNSLYLLSNWWAVPPQHAVAPGAGISTYNGRPIHSIWDTSALIFAPLFETLVFYSLLQGNLVRFERTKSLAPLIVALSFSLYHFGPFSIMLFTCISGLLFAIIFQVLSKSWWVPTLAVAIVHSLSNLVSLTFTFHAIAALKN